jgi:uncharacterized protein (UPF0276 family)
MSPFVPPRALGVGFTYQPGLRDAMGPHWDRLDFFELSPDVLCHERSDGGTRVLEYDQALLADALRGTADRPMVVHGLGLSIGSASGWSEGYLRILDELEARRRFRWHSEHLAFLLTTSPDGAPMHTGVPLPLPFTDEALDLIVPRAAAMGERYGRPFLMENFTYYLPGLPADHGRDEVAFLNDLTERSGCGLLLDLYNFHCNAVNFGFDPYAALARLRLDRVVEIHVAGGAVHDGLLMDVHSREVSPPVWDLLDWVVPRAPHLAGIVYEILEQAVPLVGVEAICRQLERARESWSCRIASPSGESSHAAA